MYGIASYMFMLTIINSYIGSTGLKEKLGVGEKRSSGWGGGGGGGGWGSLPL